MAEDQDILASLKTQNVRQFVSDVGAASKSVVGFGLASEEAAAKAKLTSIEALALRQSLYTVRRYAFWATTAIFGTAAGVVKMGITFDDVKEQATGAFEATLGSAAAARHEVNLLTADTHATGIQLGDLALQAETMQSFGFAIKDVNTDVLALANYAERAGRGVSTFEQIVEVFDRVRQNGKLTSLDLRSLTDQGIPALRIIADQLHLTKAQTTALQSNKLVIPAQYALPALAAGIGKIAGQRGTTIDQQLGITHSYVSQIFGTGEHGLFGFITKGLETINGRLRAAARGQQTGGASGFLLGLDPSGHALNIWVALTSAVRAAGGALQFAWRVSLPLRVTITALAGGALWLTSQTGLLATALKIAAAWWLITRTRMVAVLAVEKALILWTKGAAAAEYGYIAALYAYDVASAIFIGDTEAATAALVALNLAFLANPITWIIIGVAALGVGLYLLVTRVHAVRDAFIYGFQEAKKAVADLFGWIRDAWNLLSFHVPGFSLFGHHIGGFTLHVTPIGVLPGLARGGTYASGGWSVVGEKGPELRYESRGGASIIPLNKSVIGGAGDGELLAAIRDLAEAVRQGFTVNLDGQKVGEGSARAKQLREAIA